MAAEDLSDDYVVDLLKRDANSRSAKYATTGLQAFLPQRSSQPPKPNTRFLANLIRQTDNHNAALLAREAEESRRRLRALRVEKRGIESRSSRNGAPFSHTKNHRRDGHKYSSKRKRIEYSDSDSEDDGRRRRRHGDERSRRSRKDQLRDRSGDRSHDRSRDRSEDRSREKPRRRRRRDSSKDRPRDRSRDRPRDYERRQGRRRRRHGRTGGGTDSEDDHLSRHSRSRRKGHRHRHRSSSEDRDRSRVRDSCRSCRRRRSRSRASSQPIPESPVRRGSKRHHTSQHRQHSMPASPCSSLTSSSQDSGSKTSGIDDIRLVSTSADGEGLGSPPPKPPSPVSESDPLEDIIGPTLPPPERKVRVRGRGAFKSSSAMDAHFASDYNPAVDFEPNSDEGDSDQALEAFRDRQKWKQQGADRLRAAGFTEEEIRKWEKGGQKTEEDVRWAKKGEGREWDRGKVVNSDGQIDVQAEWGRLKDT